MDYRGGYRIAMKLYNTKLGIHALYGDVCKNLTGYEWSEVVNRVNLKNFLARNWNDWPIAQLPEEEEFLPPIDHQEVWAAGVTYLKSRDARMEESQQAGGGDFYDKVYDADRPELFFKSMPHRVVGHLEEVRIRKDSHWNVPEPELTIFISSAGTIEGFTIGNDMSSRDIEGENPLYLPQAKVYDGSAALGPCLLVGPAISQESVIRMIIERNQSQIFNDSISIATMKRSFTELVEYLTREMSFPNGCYLMTGTALVPDAPFTLTSADTIHITIDDIGTLTNFVA